MAPVGAGAPRLLARPGGLTLGGEGERRGNTAGNNRAALLPARGGQRQRKHSEQRRSSQVRNDAAPASMSTGAWRDRSAMRSGGHTKDSLRSAFVAAAPTAEGQRSQAGTAARKARLAPGTARAQGLGEPNGAHRGYTAVLIVPTGVGAAIGGCAGDALPVARAMSEAVDCLITHPNVLNGAMMYWPLRNTLYVEGHGLDRFSAGEWGLVPQHQNKVGLVLDSGIEEELMQRHLQVADATRATLGISMPAYTITTESLQVEKWLDPSTGASTGRIGAEDALLSAVRVLVDEHGAEAVAVVARFPDDCEEELAEYRAGEGVDALAGVEAVISHLVVEHFGMPCAHAPALPPLPLLPTVAPRSAAEETGYTFLPCVLAGLSRAPQFVPRSADHAAAHQAEAHLGHASAQSHARALWAEDVDCVVLPATAFGGAGTLALASRKKPPLFIAVEENRTVMKDPPSKFGIDAVHVANYWEALGVMVAHKAGVEPWALRAQGIRHLAEARAAALASPRRDLVMAGLESR